MYAVEQADQQGFTVDDLTVDPDAPVSEERRDDLLDGVVTLRVSGHAPARHEQAAWPYRRVDRPGGATHPAGPTTVTDTTGPTTAAGPADAARDDDATGPTTAARPADAATGLQAVIATAVPYYAWANRGPAPMRVWLPLAR